MLHKLMHIWWLISAGVAALGSPLIALYLASTDQLRDAFFFAFLSVIVWALLFLNHAWRPASRQ